MLGLERKRFRWELRTRALELGARTLVMAIVNVTPDSFSGDGLLSVGIGGALEAAVAAVDAGADIVDLGAESTRPGAQGISADEEQERLLPVLEGLRRARPDAVVSVDTYHAATAREAVHAGAEIVNDVSGLLWDRAMAATVAELRCGLVLMHTRGRPTEWKDQPRLRAGEVVPLVLEGLRERMDVCRRAGIEDERVVLDPGFGFGKRGAENFALLAGLGALGELARPVLAGMSRKGFLGEAVRGVAAEATVAEERRIATLAANVAAVLAGAHVVRVHDVRETREAVAVADAVLAARSG